MAESKLVQLNFENCSYNVCGIVAIYCIQYAKPWPYSSIRSPCCHAITSRYDSTLHGHSISWQSSSRA